MPPSLLTISSWVSFCFASFLPLESDIPDWVVCPCPCGHPGMVVCSAPHYLWSLASVQVGGEELNVEAWVPGSLPTDYRRHVCMVTSKWLPPTMVIVKPERTRGFASVSTLLSLLCSPPTNQGPRRHTPGVPGEAGAERCFPRHSGVPGGLP